MADCYFFYGIVASIVPGHGYPLEKETTTDRRKPILASVANNIEHQTVPKLRRLNV